MVVAGMQSPQWPQLDGLGNCLILSFGVWVYIQLLVNCCVVIFVLIGFDVGVMMGHVVSEYVCEKLRGFCLRCLSCHYMVNIWYPMKIGS